MIKPSYKIPTMQEIASLPPNGYKAISTFSGAGGSCLGYRMAGYRVLWASEFIPEAQEVYRLNHPNSHLDTRDIRQVTADEILEITGLGVGEIDLMDGSPPCAAFSVSGKREAGWGEEKKYSSTRQRVDDLFFEYSRILKALQPKTFVAENVQGLVTGKAKGYFKEILAELKSCGYQVKAVLLNALWLGVPQHRERLIFLGVRNDLGLLPVPPSPLPYHYTVGEALPEREIEGDHWPLPEGKMMALWIDAAKNPKAKGRFVESHLKLYGKRSWFNHRRLAWDQPCYTIVQGSQGVYHPEHPRTLTIPELKRMASLPDDFQITGSFTQKWERVGRMVPPVMMAAIAKTMAREILDKCVE